MSSDLDAIKRHIDQRFEETKELMAAGHAAVRAEVQVVSDRVGAVEKEVKSVRQSVDRVTEEVYVGRDGREPLKQIVALNARAIDTLTRKKSPAPQVVAEYQPFRQTMPSETSGVHQPDAKEAGKLLAKALGLVALSVTALVAGFYALVSVLKAAGK